MGGKTISQTIEGREKYGLTLRLSRNNRAEIAVLRG